MGFNGSVLVPGLLLTYLGMKDQDAVALLRESVHRSWQRDENREMQIDPKSVRFVERISVLHDCDRN